MFRLFLYANDVKIAFSSYTSDQWACCGITDLFSFKKGTQLQIFAYYDGGLVFSPSCLTFYLLVHDTNQESSCWSIIRLGNLHEVVAQK